MLVLFLREGKIWQHYSYAPPTGDTITLSQAEIERHFGEILMEFLL